MLELKPVSLREANDFVEKYHRHHGKTAGHKFSIGVLENGVLVGVVICGRPVARGADDGWTLEVNRLCTTGSENACSILYAAAARAAKAMGYKRIITYILGNEHGTSLKASGWKLDGCVKGRSWSCQSRPREDVSPTCDKQRWVKDFFKKD